MSSIRRSASSHFTARALSVVLAAAILVGLPAAIAQTPVRPQRLGKPTVGRPTGAQPGRLGTPTVGRPRGAQPARGVTARGLGGGQVVLGGAAMASGAFEPYRNNPIDWQDIADEGKQIVFLDAPAMKVGEFLQTISLLMG